MMISCHSAPPVRLLLDAQFGVDGSTALGSHLEERSVFVRIEIAPDLEDDDDEERGSVPETVHPSGVGVEFQRADGPFE